MKQSSYGIHQPKRIKMNELHNHTEASSRENEQVHPSSIENWKSVYHSSALSSGYFGLQIGDVVQIQECIVTQIRTRKNKHPMWHITYQC